MRYALEVSRTLLDVAKHDLQSIQNKQQVRESKFLNELLLSPDSIRENAKRIVCRIRNKLGK